MPLNEHDRQMAQHPLGEALAGKLMVHPDAVRLVGQLKRIMPTTYAPSSMGLCAPEVPLTWAQLIPQMQHYMNVGLLVTPHENKQGYDVRVPEGWVEPQGLRGDSGLIVVDTSEVDEPAPSDVVHHWYLRMQYAEAQRDQGLVWEQAWARALVALPDPQPLGPVGGQGFVTWDRVEELQASWERRLANQTQVIKNLSEALESSGKATAEWRGKYETLLANVQECGLPIHRLDLED